MKLTVAVLAMCVVLAGCSPSSEPPTANPALKPIDAAALQAVVEKAAKDLYVPGAMVVLRTQDGKLTFSDPVSKYVPGVPDGDHITIAQLLTMRSGLFNYTAASEFAETLDADPAKAWTPQEGLAIAFAHPREFAPGAE